MAIGKKAFGKENTEVKKWAACLAEVCSLWAAPKKDGPQSATSAVSSASPATMGGAEGIEGDFQK